MPLVCFFHGKIGKLTGQIIQSNQGNRLREKNYSIIKKKERVKMVNLYDIDIRRIICHEIEKKKAGMEHATVLFSESLLKTNDDVNRLIIERLR
jgi:hypothetical protein